MVEPVLVFDDQPVPVRAGDTILVALQRAGIHPVGGCLCTAGDCPNCLAVVDGVAYTRTCLTPARPGTVVSRQHVHDPPPPSESPEGPPPHIPTEHVHCDVVVIGAGQAGTAEVERLIADGLHVEVVDFATNGEEAVGVYPGPLVVTRGHTGLRHLHAGEVVVATGSMEVQPACPGNQLAGILTPRAAETLHRAGVDLGTVVAVGEPPDVPDVEPVEGTLVRISGEDHVRSVVVEADGRQQRHPCDTLVVGLGRQPRDVLARMGAGMGARAVGSATAPATPQPPPAAGTVCRCSDVTVEDLASACARGFDEMELLKRATLAGTGTCQGSACLPHLQAFLDHARSDADARGHGRFTARPLARQATMGEVAADWHPAPTRRTPLHKVHLELGATMERAGGWWRPWHYDDADGEYWAVRAGVSLGDVSTLAKFEVAGPDAAEFLDRIYPSPVSRLRPGRSKYVLLLDEGGHVFDDGMVCRRSEDRFYLTVTSAGGGMAEMWLRDWVDGWGMDVRIMDRTMSLAAINVTGPLAADLLARAGMATPLAFADHTEADVAGVRCDVLRLSFTGERSYELHHDADHAEKLWRALTGLGRDLGVRPHGLDVLTTLRLEKGHLIVGVDTEMDSTPRRLRHDWAVKLDDRDFLGRAGLARTADIPLDRVLTGFTIDTADPPFEGATIWSGTTQVGYATSVRFSRVLGRTVGLGWVRLDHDGEGPDDLRIGDHLLVPTDPPFYDPDGSRARA